MKKSKNYLALPAIVLAALYLTFLVNLHTLETSLQRVFIFCYFVVMGVLACFLKGKYAVGKPFPLQSRIAAALLAALLVGAGWNTFLPACALPAGRLAHVRALGKAALYARRVVRCVLPCAARAAVSRPPHGKTRLDRAAESARLSSHGKLCVSLFHERSASSRRI